MREEAWERLGMPGVSKNLYPSLRSSTEIISRVVPGAGASVSVAYLER